jgi:acetate kinase
MRQLGIEIDAGRNEPAVGREGEISIGEPGVNVLIVPKNEELPIAADTYQFLTSADCAGGGLLAFQ